MTTTQYATYFEDGSKVVIDVNKLWKATNDNPTVDVQVYDLLWVMQNDYWNNDVGKPVTPFHVVTELEDELCTYHRSCIFDADLSYAIIVMGDPETGKVDEVLDGIHRISKAFITNCEMIPVKFVTPEQNKVCRITDEKVLASLVDS